MTFRAQTEAVARAVGGVFDMQILHLVLVQRRMLDDKNRVPADPLCSVQAEAPRARRHRDSDNVYKQLSCRNPCCGIDSGCNKEQ